jgi:hypothetical protein
MPSLLSATDERHGQGILYWPTGAWYEGTWAHNLMHGSDGKYCFENVPLHLINLCLKGYRVTYIKAHLKMMTSMVMAGFFTLMVIIILEVGRMVSSTAREHMIWSRLG